MTSGHEHFSGSAPLNAAPRRTAAAGRVVYFRGYLANQAELARHMGLRRAAEHTVVDLIARCYEHWGRRLPEHLDGQFALVIVDEPTGDILLARDALGVLPLYYYIKPHAVNFASRLRDLVDEEARGQLNLGEIERYVLFGNNGHKETAYSNIARLEPGRSLWIHNGSMSFDVTWDPRRVASIRYGRSEEYVEHFIDLIRTAVEGALLDATSPWIALSGGLDSNTILPPALKYCEGLKAFSIVSPKWPEVDESQWIERIVAARGISWHRIDAEDILPFRAFPKDFCGGPDSAVMHQHLIEVLNDLLGGAVLLTGDGGDSFMGSQMGPVPVHLADPLFSGSASDAIRTMAHWMRHAKPARPPVHWILHGLILPSIRHLLRRSVRPPHYHLHPTWLRCGGRPGSKTGALHPKAVAPHCRTPGQQAIFDDLWQAAEDTSAFDATYAVRHPLFSRSVFEYLWAIPWSQKQAPLCDRYLQRRALKGLVDDDIRTRIGYGGGTRSFVEGLRRSPQWQEYLCEGPAMAELGLVDAEHWKHAIHQACVGQTNAEPLLVRAISVEVWLKQLADYRPKANRGSRMPALGRAAGTAWAA